VKVEFLNKFYKDLDKLNSKKLKSEVISVIDNVERSSALLEVRNIKKLKNSKIAYRIRVGDYRIGIFYEHNIVEFARIVHRKDIYKVFP
jgi:mRNA interferase RelE/StbE